MTRSVASAAPGFKKGVPGHQAADDDRRSLLALSEEENSHSESGHQQGADGGGRGIDRVEPVQRDRNEQG